MPSCYRALPRPTPVRTLSFLLCTLTLLVFSQAPRAALEEGKNFQALVPPQPTRQRDKI